MNASAPLAPKAALRERLRALEEAGARAFAPSAYAFAETLAARGEALGGGAGERLIARAIARADALARELDAAKERARSALIGVDDPPASARANVASVQGGLAGAIEAGHVLAPLRAARRSRLAPATRSRPDDVRWTARLAAEARARGVSFAAPAPGPIAAALYASSRDELSAILFARRAEAEVPSNAGPYNPLAIAARALAELSSFAPAYLSATIAYLDELAPLLALPAPPPDRARPSHVASRAKRPSRRPR